MARMGSGAGGNASNGEKYIQDDFEKLPTEKSKLYRVIDTIIDGFVKVIAIATYSVGRLIENFVGHQHHGIRIIGFCCLAFGLIVSADGFFQSWGGRPLVPFFENDWIGGWGIFRLVFPIPKMQFILPCLTALGVQYFQSFIIRGASPSVALAQYKKFANFTKPTVSENATKLPKALAKDVDNAGMSQRFFLLAIAGGSYALEFHSVFTARPCWGLPPGMFITIFMYNMLVIFAAEAGHNIWLKANEII
ncbi:MAG: hypothetical protein F6K65_18030 [Moorea sp. SIO3C2]|nr:hypothetical protein [Moorena sp. SIO3C2]